MQGWLKRYNKLAQAKYLRSPRSDFPQANNKPCSSHQNIFSVKTSCRTTKNRFSKKNISSSIKKQARSGQPEPQISLIDNIMSCKLINRTMLTKIWCQSMIKPHRQHMGMLYDIDRDQRVKVSMCNIRSEMAQLENDSRISWKSTDQAIVQSRSQTILGPARFFCWISEWRILPLNKDPLYHNANSLMRLLFF